MRFRRASFYSLIRFRKRLQDKRKEGNFYDTRKSGLKWTYHYHKYYTRFHRKTMVQDYRYFNKHIRD